MLLLLLIFPSYDFLYIHDGSDDTAASVQLSGESANVTTSTGNAVFLAFKSDDSQNFGGFSIQIDIGKNYVFNSFTIKKLFRNFRTLYKSYKHPLTCTLIFRGNYR